MEEKIKEAYMKIKMDETEKDKILDNITGSEAGRHKAKLFRSKLLKAAMVAVCVCVGSGTVYAAYQWMSAGEVASMMGESVLAEKFNKTDAEIQVQENDVYRATYLGEVTGKNLREQEIEVEQDKTYFVMAVERKDEQKISYETDHLVLSPFVKGFAPWRFNIYSLGGGGKVDTYDNVMYMMIECPNVEIFADRGVYLGLMDSMAPGSDNYQFDEESGEISCNPGYSGTNLLFELDLDKSKANPQEADKLLKECEDNANAEDEEEDSEDESEDDDEEDSEENTETTRIVEYLDFIKRVKKDMENLDDMISKSKLVEAEQELTVDEKGSVSFVDMYGDKLYFQAGIEELSETLNDNNNMTVGHLAVGGHEDTTEVFFVVAEYRDGKYFGKRYERIYNNTYILHGNH